MHFLQQFFNEIDFGRFIGLAIPIVAIVVGGTVAVAGMYFHNRRREMWHQTARVALEKGQPLPAFEDEDGEVEETKSRSRGTAPQTRRNDIRVGLILVAVGGGLYFFLSALVSDKLAAVGAIPGFIGIALFLNGLFTPARDPNPIPGQPPMK